MEKPKKKWVEKDYTSLQDQIKVHRVLLLVITLVMAIGAIRFQNMYLEIQEHYQSIAELTRCFHEQYQGMSENYQEILRLNQETSALIQNVLDTFQYSK